MKPIKHRRFIMLKKFIYLIALCCFVLSGCVTSSVRKYPSKGWKSFYQDGAMLDIPVKSPNRLLGSYNPKASKVDITKPFFPETKKRRCPPKKQKRWGH